MAGAAVGLSTSLPLIPLLMLALLLGCAAIFARTRPARALAVLCAVVVAAAVAGRAHRDLQRVTLPDGVVVIDGVVVDVGFGDEGQRLTVDVDAVLPVVGGAFAAQSLRLDVSLVNAHVDAGDRVRLRGRIHEPTPSLSPGTFDGESYALARGLHGHLSIDDPRDVVVTAHGQAPFFTGLRLALRERLLDQLTPREAGLLLALLIGDTSLFEEEQRAAYRHVGAGHLLAVSGLQVTLLAVLLQRLCSVLVLLTPLGRRGRGLVAGTVVAVVGVWGFVFLCGLPPSAVRAGVMATLVVVGQTLGRRVALVDVLGAAGLLTVLASPTSVLDAGFLLSYAAVLGLAASSQSSTEGRFNLEQTPSLWSKAQPALTASIVAGLVTLPLSAWLFAQVAPAGLVANIVLVPVASALQLPALVGGALGALLNVPLLSHLGAEAALVLEALVFGLAEWLPDVRTIDAPSALSAAVLTTTSLLTAWLLVSGRTRFGVVGVGVIVVVIGFSLREPAGMRITFLPVGQGDGAVIELPDGTVFVIDGGGRVPFDKSLDEAGRAEVLTEPGTRVLLPYLRRRGIEQVDVMVLSHPHPDHAGGLRAVAAALPVRRFWWAGDQAGALVAPLLEQVAKTGEVKSTPGLIGRFRYGDVSVDVLAPAPPERTPTYPELGVNDNSLVLRFCLRGGCALFPGDIERWGEELLLQTNAPDRLRSRIVKAPHHGSKTSSSPAFVAVTGAAEVVLCTGRHNHFGFPDTTVVERWQKSGARIWDTAHNGEVTFWIDGDDVTVESHR